jgi:uncharacterized protein (TIGR03118 family)
MKTTWKNLAPAGVAALALSVLPPAVHGATGANPGYLELSLISDMTNVASHSDGRLLNPWGIVVGRNTLWVNDNHSGLDTTYTASGAPLKFAIHVPAPGGGPGAPTGLVFNDTTSFTLSNGTRSAPATFLLATEDGTIAAWNAQVTGSNAVIAADRSGSNAVYKGLAIGLDTNGAPWIYAADFHNGMIDVFDAQFHYARSFTDTNLPANYAPFNVRRLRDKLFVTFAKQLLPDAMDDDKGPGHGYLDIFDADGTLLRRFASGGALNSPWGLVVAPPHFGIFSRALLVGNFGDGRINAYELLTGKWLGTMQDALGNELVLDGLWGLTFEKEEVAGQDCQYTAQRLYFTAGPGAEADGVVGLLRPVTPVMQSGGGGY